MFTYVYTSLPRFTPRALLAFTYVYHFLLVITYVYHW